MKRRKRLGELLVESGRVSQQQIDKAWVIHQRSGERLSRILVQLGFITETGLLEILVQNLGIPLIDLSATPPEREAVQLIPLSLAERHGVIPIRKSENRLTVAMIDPTNFFAIDDLRMVTQCDIEPVMAVEADILRAIDQSYSVCERVEKSVNQLQKEEHLYTSEIETAEDAPVINIVNSLISQSIKNGASDIHIEPLESGLRVRFRIDGVLREITSFPKHTQGAIISRIKIVSNMDIAEKRVPQDGRLQVQEAGRAVDIRVSSLPTLYGEKIVLRILDPKGTIQDLNSLGFSEANLNKYQKMYQHSYGMILITGPTGSGKTTTLHSTLTELNSPTKNIITVEDPVEYRLPGINQVQVNPKAGLTFAKGLRSILRQDPNIIMVGEIRDRETAEIAIRAALTGHLVLSTLHTNDAAGAVTRLVDMGVEPFLVASSVLGTMAQRLVRKICPECREKYSPEADSSQRLTLSRVAERCDVIYRGTGCLHCGNTGYRDRMSIHEVMPMTNALRELVAQRASTADLAKTAIAEGMKTMYQDGMDKVQEGLTTVEEILRVAYSEI
ncbi:MAG TPA: ATPase, T2SS/T4P/T4SS family [Negativicutes bacterium]|nr:ATPase, T2SS/T4P/T4SS family [Negativicutes bacterium]